MPRESAHDEDTDAVERLLSAARPPRAMFITQSVDQLGPELLAEIRSVNATFILHPTTTDNEALLVDLMRLRAQPDGA